MKLYIVRHAQSKRNIGKKSEVDTELTEDGKEQARRLGSYFNNLKIDKIYCSKLRRAKDTLKEILPYLKKIPVTYTKKINEHKMGIYEKKGKDDWASYARDAKKAGELFYLFKPKEGDSLNKTYERAGKFYKHLLNNHSKDTILLVGHGIFSLYLILNAFNLPITEGKYYGLSNAAVSQIDIKNKKITYYHIDDFHHLISEGLKKLEYKK